MQLNLTRGVDGLKSVATRLKAWVFTHPKTVGTGVVLWLATWLLMWLAVPGWLQPQLEQTLSTQLGRTVKVQSVQFRPWSLEVIVNGLDIASADGKSSQLKVARIWVDAELQSLLRMAPVIDALEIDEPQLKLTHLTGGSYDVDDLIRKFTAPSDAGSSEPFHFALYNVQIRGGQVDFDDQPAKKIHQLRELQLGIPFVSNLPSKREVKVQPNLSLVLNGERLDSTAWVSPFASDRQAQVSLKLPSWDIVPYLNYWPAQLPIRPIRGDVSLDLAVHFDQGDGDPKSPGHDAHQLALSGRVQLQNWQWTSSALTAAKAKNPVWLQWQQIDLHMKRVAPLERSAELSSLELVGLEGTAFKDASGQWLGWKSAPAAAQPKQPASDKGLWRLALAQLRVKDGQLRWLPDGLSTQRAMVVQGVQVHGQNMHWPMSEKQANRGAVSGQFHGPSWQIDHKAGTGAPGTVSFVASMNNLGGTAQVQFDAANLANVQWLAPQKLEPEVQGLLQGQLDVSWSRAADQSWQASVKTPSVSLEQVQLKTALQRPAARGGDVQGANGKPMVSGVKRLELQDAQFNWPQNHITLARVLIDDLQAEVSRNAQGQWIWEQWLGASAALSQPQALLPWRVQLGEVQVRNGHLVWWDAAASGALESSPVTATASFAPMAAASGVSSTQAVPNSGRGERGTARLEATGLQALVKGVVLTERGLGDAKASYDIRSQVQSMSRSNPRKGSLALVGTLESTVTKQSPAIVLRQTVQVQRLPVHALEPYVRQYALIHVQQADASVKGRMSLKHAGGSTDPVEWRMQADMALDDVLAYSLNPDQELLSWKSLKLSGVRVNQQASQPMQVVVGKTRLADFYARLIITDKGQINLQQLGRKKAQEEAVQAAAASAVPETQAASAASAQSVSAQSAAPANDPMSPQIRFDGIEMVNGRIHFSDFFIRPNYSANLSDLNGTLGAFSTSTEPGKVQMADLLLRGKAQGTADLLIQGQLNPLAKPLALNIKGKVSDLELPPLSPYAAKYLGYALERGKLHVDVGYEIDPQGNLTGSNNFVLNQLTLGEKIEGQGTNLPVKLAISLLKDRNGVIDVNLPLTGSINDPQFSIGPLVWRMVLTLIGRAIISPFSLIAGGGAGGVADGQASIIGFDPGSERLTAASKDRLDVIVKAMSDRPELKMSLIGQVSGKTERAAWQREQLEQLVWAEKQRSLGQTEPMQGERGAVTAQEYPVLLKEVYRQAKIKKPRNLVGLAKEISVPEMQELLMQQFVPTDDVLRTLAFARAQKVKNLLAAKGLAVERIFLATPQIEADASQVQLQALVD
jgi:hypothetical protein